MCYTETRGRQ